MFDNETQMDYGLFFHEIESKRLDVSPLTVGMAPEQIKNYYKRQLTYSELNLLGETMTRHCRISEPFLNGVLGEISSLLFRSGVPDFPDEEKKRLAKSMK
jgi:hypothetical protein